MGVYLLARRWLPTWQAFSASVLLVGAPEVAFWALQVMLDIPAYAWLTFSALVFLQYLDNGKIRDLYLAMILMLCALYTKQNVVFAVVVFALLMLKVRGVLVLKERHVWQAIILFAIGLTPLLYLLSEFGQVNLSSVSGARAGDLGWPTLDAWIFYLREMPGQLGWPTFILGFSFIVGMAVRPSWRLPNRQDGLLLVGWLLIGYVFFSFIALKIPRHNLTVLLPMVLFAVLFLNRTLTRFGQRYASTAAVILAFGTFAYTLFFQPIPYVKGYAEAAHLVSELAPEKSVVLFSGIRDGNFVFNVRANTDRKDLSVLRADKLLLRFAIERERGFEDRGLGDKNILHDLFNRYAVHYVVAQTDFWIDIPSMRSLQDLLQDNSHFEIVRRLKVKANIHVDDQELVIYRNLGKVADTPSSISLEMVGIGQTFNGKFGNE